jgi:endonuclease/exonuclease/phosphatase family metal-dependent hydrolase
VLALVAVVFALALQAIRLVSPALFDDFADRGYLVSAAAAALIVALGPLTAPALLRSLGARRALLLAVGGLAVARLGLQAADQVTPWLAGLTTFLAMESLTLVLALASALRGPRRLVQGVLLGAAIDVAVRSAFHTWDPVWQPGLLPWVVAVASAGAAVLLVAALPRDRVDAAPSILGSIALGPFLFLHAVFLQNPGFLGSRADVGLAASAGTILLVDAAAIAVLGSFGRRWAGPLQAATVLGGIGLAILTGPASLAALALATVGSAAMLAVAWAPEDRPSAMPAGLAAACGALVFAGLLVTYQKDRPLPVPESSLPAGAAVLLAALPVIARARLPDRAGGRGLALASTGLLVVPLWLWLEAAALGDAGGLARDGELTLLDYNVHFGVTDDDQVDPEAIADVIRAHDPAVVVLQEAGRGVLDNGMTDVVEWLSWRLGMPYVTGEQVDDRFRPTVLHAPGIDVASASHGMLPARRGPERSYLRVTFADVGDRPLQVVAAHLSGREEDEPTRSRQIDALVRAAGEPSNTVIVGDLNAPLHSPGITILQGAGFTSVQRLIGEGEATFPEEDIVSDHVLIGPGLSAVDVTVPEVEASDHYPVVVTIERP